MGVSFPNGPQPGKVLRGRKFKGLPKLALLVPPQGSPPPQLSFSTLPFSHQYPFPSTNGDFFLSNLLVSTSHSFPSISHPLPQTIMLLLVLHLGVTPVPQFPLSPPQELLFCSSLPLPRAAKPSTSFLSASDPCSRPTPSRLGPTRLLQGQRPQAAEALLVQIPLLRHSRPPLTCHRSRDRPALARPRPLVPGPAPSSGLAPPTC